MHIMQGTILEKILKLHSKSKNIAPDEIISVDVDHILIPDNSVVPIFDILENHQIKPHHENIYLALTNFPYQYEFSYSHIQKKILDLAKKYKFKILDNYKGLWFYNLLQKNIIEPGNIFLGRASTINFFSPLNNLNISSGMQDIIQAMITSKHDYLVPEVIHIVLEGHLQQNISGKDIALYLIKELSSSLMNGHYLLEFSGSLLEEISAKDLYSLALHHYNMNASSFTFPPLQQINKVMCGVFPDSKVKYAKEFTFDLTNLSPLVENNGKILGVKELCDKKIDKVFIGNSIGGTLADMEFLAKILADKKVKIPCFVTPSSHKILTEAMQKGYMTSILNGGCILLTPSTGISSATNGLIPIEGENIVSTAVNILSIQVKEIPMEFYTSSIETAINTAITGHLATCEEGAVCP
ncbi:MAG: aconitase family protein [Candidatus Margulisbacteria bacterium]|nr:aconitase family protein [Candidatus Margulisiibacteriota bacterium]